MVFGVKHWIALVLVLVLGYWLGTRGTFGAIPFIGSAGSAGSAVA